MKFECSTCNKSFGSQESLAQHNQTKHAGAAKPGSSSLRTYVIGGMTLAIVIFLGMSVYSYTQGPGQFDSFAACLTEKGAVMYGNDFCSFTVQQLNYFGKSQEHLNYVKCVDNEGLCDEKDVRTTPTWEYKGQMYPQVQTFKALSAATGCKIE